MGGTPKRVLDMGSPPTPEREASTTYLFLTLLIAAALLIPAGFARASGPDGTVRGFVTDSVSSSAVVGASVRLDASDLPWTFETTTDAAGYFSLNVPNHVYTVQIAEAAHNLRTTSASVGSGQIVWLNVTLTPAAARSARLQGFVTDSGSSAPVTQGRIVSELASGSGYWNASAMNASGYYEMALIPGTYQVSTDGVLGYVPYSNSGVALAAGQVRWFNLSLDPNPLVAWINGTVLDANNYSRITGATIAANVGGLQLPSTTSNATGSFSIQAPSGDVQFAADAVGYAPLLTSVYVWGAGTYAPYFYLTPLSTEVRGYVRDGLTGAPIPGALVVANPFWSTGYFDQDPADASGYYELHLTADDFMVSASAPGYTPWSSWAFLWSAGVYWANVTLWPIISTLQGYVLDASNGSHVPGLTVYVSDVRSGYSTSAAADPSGFFSFSLPPSPAITVRVLGTPLYAGTIAYVTTRPYATTWANLSLDRLAAQVRATVTDAETGLPIPAATVYVSWSFGTNWGSTNLSGVAQVTAPSGLGLTVQAWATGYFAWYGTLPASSGLQTLSISLNPALPTNVTVQGYVRDAGTNASIVSAFIEATGYDGTFSYDFTDGAGYYQIALVARPQTIHATYYGYSEGLANVSPTTGGTIWVNLSLSQDSTPPVVLDFSASPSSNLQPSNPATLVAHVNETSFGRASLSILMLRSTAGNVGTFLNLGPLSADSVSVAPSSPGNVSVSSTWDTRTPVGRLSDGTATEWWPAIPSYAPFQVLVPGYWDNATLSTPAYGTAVFDSRSGSLLYVYTPYGYIGPQDQPSSTFTPYASGIRIDLTTAAILGPSLVTGSSYQLGTLRMTVSASVPAGSYAALLETWAAGSNYAYAAVLLSTAVDSTSPIADAGPDRTVNQGDTATLDGTASWDNVGIANYTWSFVDGTARVLYGAVTSYRFLTPGSYLVTLTVRDAAGNSASNALLVTVLDTAAPTVSIEVPSEAASLSGSVSLSATASDNVAVVRVEFLVDGVSAGNVTASPFQLALDTRSLSNGNHTIVAVAYDAAGNSASATRHVSVANTPGGNSGTPAGLDVFVWGGLVALLAAVGVVALILARRRRPRRPVTAPPPNAGFVPPQPEPANVEGRDSSEL